MIYIVIPVFNRKDFTQDCLVSLQKQTFKSFKTIIVDDGSTDGTQKMVQEQFPEVILLETSGDLFWTATINLGISYALKEGAEYVLTLNNDTYAQPDFMEKMRYWAKQYPMALFGAFALDAVTQKPIYAGEVVDWKRIRSESWVRKLKEGEFEGIRRVTHFPGRGLLIPKSCFEKIGLFAEKIFPHYAADYDFTSNAFRNGFDIYCNLDAKLFIYPDESGDKKNREKKTIKNYLSHISGLKGGGNIKDFTNYVLRNCPKMYIPTYWTVGVIRRLVGYWIK